MKRTAALIPVALLLAACSGAPAASTPTPTPALPGEMRYDEVVQLRDAAVAAGYPCPAWEQGNYVRLASQSGTCSDADVFSVYLTEADVSEAVQLLKGLPTGPTLLVGPNWIINTKDAASLREKMGGMVVIGSQ